MQHEEALEAAGGTLIYLTSEPPEVIAAAKQTHGLEGDIRSVDPALWAQWGISRRDKPELPHPTTLVVDPQGRLVFERTHVNFTQRVSPSALLDDWDSLGLPPPIEDIREDTSPDSHSAPDWDSATRLLVEAGSDTVTLVLELAPGFHVYGTREEIGRPLEVSVAGHPELVVPIPPGEEKSLEALGSAWVLTGTQRLEIPMAPPLSGELALQICTQTACSMPRVEAWSTAP